MIVPRKQGCAHVAPQQLTHNAVVWVGAPLAFLVSAKAACVWGCLLGGRSAFQEGIVQIQELVKSGCAGVREASVARAQPKVDAAGHRVHVRLRQPVCCLQRTHTFLPQVAFLPNC